MINEPLMDAVVQMVMFLEFSDHNMVDEDAAIGMMEQVTATLQELRSADKQEFLNYLKGRASHAESEKQRQFLEDFASSLGLFVE